MLILIYSIVRWRLPRMLFVVTDRCWGILLMGEKPDIPECCNLIAGR